ncbi:MAG: preprotein translocase subunit SecY [Candidatus Yonathbacteria bacterium]|nr:preprotein translocase subunit SecY [Candidatus Yonathbacteria bacterium]
MDTFAQKLKMIASDASLRNRVLFVLVALVLFRLLANIPIPAAAGQNLGALLANDQALGFLNILTGGGLSAVSIVMLGVGPYITASIIMQLLTMMSPKIKAMQSDEGELGRRKMTQYSRLLTVPLALMQGYGLIAYLVSKGVLVGLTPFDTLTNTIIVTAGSMLLMWIGELISEFGIGNGVSLIIFAGIVSRIPVVFGEVAFSPNVAQIPTFIAAFVATMLTIIAVVYMTEAERPVPITYAKQIRAGRATGGGATYLPLRLNQAGVIPIIFALSILTIPTIVANALATMGNGVVQSIAMFVQKTLANNWVHGALYFGFVFIFTYFYTAVTFDPEAISNNLQKNGAFVPGIRPGASTAEYLSKILGRITLAGAVFLGAIAVLPLVMQNLMSDVPMLAVGGTSLLIVVSVVIDLIKKIDAQITMREY